ncbi:oxidoreductase [Rhodococcus sp. X156]|uniref:oxidoreductase n=1 Tax=Rhodococcus sp. X156 TaxID=2499145 RepID=UPI000FD7DD28|nr:oxidoreductase [Rhodococcus sp. X156]
MSAAARSSAQPSADDPLVPILRLPGVAEAAESAGAAIAEVHRHRANRRGFPLSATEASIRAARASATLDGGAPELPAEDSDGEVADPVLAGSVRVAAALDGTALEATLRVWSRAPLQVLARLHLLAASGLSDPDALGRPRPGAGVAQRLDLLAQLVTGGTKVPAAVLAAVVHGELVTLAPFGTADGVVARAASRLVAASTGLDPKNLTVPEVYWMRRPAQYRDEAAAFAAGSADGIATWVLSCCAALEAGAREATSIADAHPG